MKKIMLIVFALFILPSVIALNVDVEKLSSGEVLIAGLNKPVVFDLTLTNSGTSGTFELYNLLGFSMSPNAVVLGQGGSKNITLELIHLGEVKERGFYTFTYYIKRNEATQEQKQLTFKIIDLKDGFNVGSGEIDPESRIAEVFIINKENFNYGDMDVRFSSPFFDFEESFSLGPKETKTFTVNLNSENFRELTAGFYTLNANVDVDGKTALIEGVVRFVEKDIVTSTRTEYGFLINTHIIEKKNIGNVVTKSETVIKKNIISRLFTLFEPEPDFVEREGSTVYYTWSKDIRPGETFEISVKTNWLFPFILILLLVAIVFLMKYYTKTDLTLRKRVSFVKTKGGEFALKVSVFANTKTYLERVQIIDRLPSLVKVHERFGGEQPTKIDEKNRRIEWNFERLEPGETRVLSYIVYSKVGVMGKFALPTATAIYEKDGKISESQSNRAFFMAEPRKEELNE